MALNPPNSYSALFDGMWKEMEETFSAEQLQKVREVKDEASFTAFVEEVKSASEHYKDGTKSTRRRMKMGVQRFCAKFSEFLECFAGIAEVVKGVHSQGGSLAYGSLATLLMLIRNKHDREEKIGTYLDRAKETLDGLTDWQKIYDQKNTPALTAAIIEVYKKIFRFTMRAWKYYSGQWHRRWLSIRTAKFGIQRHLDELRDMVERVNSETNRLHHAGQDRLEKGQKGLVEGQKGLINRLSALEESYAKEQQRKWQDHCRGVQHRLGCPDPVDPGGRSRRLQKERRELEEDDPQTYEAMETGSLDTLSGLPAYRDWRESHRGGTLLLWALNHHDSSATDPFWLSSAMTDLVLVLREQQRKVVFHAVKDTQESPSAILALVVYEILRWDQNFWAEQKQFVDISLNDGDVSALAKALLTRWAWSHPDEPVFLVLDGIDKWIHDGADLDSGSWREVMDGLLECLIDVKVLRICILGQHNSWSKHITNIIQLGCASRGLSNAFWKNKCLRQRG